MINVAIMGFGTIGSGVYELIRDNNAKIKAAINNDIRVNKILELRDFKGTEIENLIVNKVEDIVNDEETDIVVECMGGTNPAYEFVKSMLLAGKHVVTSNKALVAAYGTELLQIAREKNINFLFEASVGGGIPVIRTVTEALSGEYIESIEGILNGTTNFILTKMDEEGEDFALALKAAQELGYAEKNPEADVEGHDTCRKIAILSSLASGKEVNFEDIYTEGITKVDTKDFRYAKNLKASVKLIGRAKLKNGKLYSYVCPTMIGKKHTLYAVSDVFNGVLIKGNMLGDCMLYGSGAGKLPTASAVTADIIEVSKNLHSNIKLGWSSDKIEVEDMKETSHRYFVRLNNKDDRFEKSVLESFGADKIYRLDGEEEFALLSKEMKEADFLAKYESISEAIKFIRTSL